MAQLQNEIAEKELIKKFRHDKTWMQELKSKPNWVNADVIKIPRRGAAPTVLINNTIYPIVKNDREDDFIIVALHKYDTTNTTVSDDELYALPYEKLSDVQVQHREELEDKTAAHGLWSLAVPANSATTPVIETTGENDGTGRKRLITKDLINLKTRLRKLTGGNGNLICVLSAEHEGDLLIEDAAREKSWGNMEDGSLTKNHMGFKLYPSTSENPMYKKVSTVWTRLAFGAVDVAAKEASIVFLKQSAVKAPGSVKRYARAAADDPENRENTIGFRCYYVCVSMQDEGNAAIVSGTAA